MVLHWYGPMVMEFGLFIWQSMRSHLLKGVCAFWEVHCNLFLCVHVCQWGFKLSLFIFFRKSHFIYCILLSVVLLSDSEGAIEYLLACGLGRGSHIFQHSSDPFPLQYVNFFTKVKTFWRITFLKKFFLTKTLMKFFNFIPMLRCCYINYFIRWSHATFICDCKLA